MLREGQQSLPARSRPKHFRGSVPSGRAHLLNVSSRACQLEMKRNVDKGYADLASYFALELNPRARINKAKILQHFNPLLVIGQELQVLIRHPLLELIDILLDQPFAVTRRELPAR